MAIEIRIKNMVCRHCVAALKEALSTAGIESDEVGIGYARVTAMPDEAALKRLDDALLAGGFERIVDRDAALVEQVKLAVLHHVRDEEECKLKLSACLEDQIGVAYDTLSRMFSQLEGRTIEKYHIAQKVERVKELLEYGGRTLDEIAFMTDYSSAAHLSRQFKAVTGMTPTEYARLKNGRKSLDSL